MMLKANNIAAWDRACGLPVSVPLPFPMVDIDSDYWDDLDKEQYEIVDDEAADTKS